MDVEDRRRKETLKRRWMDSVNVDLREKGLPGEDTQNCAVWRQLVRPQKEVGKDAQMKTALTRRHRKRNWRSQKCEWIFRVIQSSTG